MKELKVGRSYLLRSIKLNGTCENSAIRTDKLVVAEIDGIVDIGIFSRQHYGWKFEGLYDAGSELDALTGVWEIVGWAGRVKAARKGTA